MNPLSRADQVKVLREFLRGDVSCASFRGQLAGHMAVEGDWGNFSIEITKPLEVKIAISPSVCALAGAGLRPARLRRRAGHPELKHDPLGSYGPPGLAVAPLLIVL